MSREMKKIQEEGNPCSYEVDEQRWQAVCERNQVWDDIFVFAVRTTGCTADPVVPPGERIGKIFLFTRLHLKPN